MSVAHRLSQILKASIVPAVAAGTTYSLMAPESASHAFDPDAMKEVGRAGLGIAAGAATGVPLGLLSAAAIRSRRALAMRRLGGALHTGAALADIVMPQRKHASLAAGAGALSAALMANHVKNKVLKKTIPLDTLPLLRAEYQLRHSPTYRWLLGSLRHGPDILSQAGVLHGPAPSPRR